MLMPQRMRHGQPDEVSFGSKAEKLGMSTICPVCPRKRNSKSERLINEYTPLIYPPYDQLLPEPEGAAVAFAATTDRRR
jgi:hypothetical protein